jgi:GNAT superfamily N-acetyltransferase
MDLAVRRAIPDDLDTVTATVSSAFFDDPVWSWVFPDPSLRMAQFAAWWRLLVTGGIANDTLWVTPDCEAVAIWTPPGGHKMLPDDAERVPGLLGALVGDRIATVLEGLMLFGAHAVRDDEPHWYLGVLATHTAHQGHGIGMAVLRENLLMVDEAGLPAYLESSNPVNDDRYRGVGFEAVGGFDLPDGPHVTTMWREAR